MILLLAGCSHDRRTVLLIYSPLGKRERQDFAQRFTGTHPEIAVKWEELEPSEILDRIRVERDSPQADVWLGAPADLFDRAAREGLLEPYVPTWGDQVPAEAHDSANRWYGVYLAPEVIVYNDKVVKAKEAPKDWDDLLEPQWKGALLMRDPTESGGMRALVGALLERSSTMSRSTAAGWSWLRRLDANTKDYSPDVEALFQSLARGDGAVAVDDISDVAFFRERRHLPVSYVLPTSGTPLAVDAIAILKGSGHPEAARAFYEFVGSNESLIDAARESMRIPARIDIADDSLPASVRTARQQMKPISLNRKLMADSLDTWMNYWQTRVRRK